MATINPLRPGDTLFLQHRNYDDAVCCMASPIRFRGGHCCHAKKL